MAAKLKLTAPSSVKKGHDYTVQIDGSFSQSEVQKRAFVISVIQFSSKRCRYSAQAENAWANRSNTLLEWYFASKKHPQNVGIFENASPFTRPDGFTAGTRGTRHVCAYMYSKAIKPSSALAPIARADAGYRVR